MSQSSSGIDYEEFRPFEVGLTPLVANGSNLGVQQDLKSLFPKEIGSGSMVQIFTFSPNIWSLSGVYHWILHFKSFPMICGTPKSDIRIKSYGHSKLACRPSGPTRQSGPNPAGPILGNFWVWKCQVAAILLPFQLSSILRPC